MSTPIVGVTHDVVIYEASGNIAPVGLVVDAQSYRTTAIPPLVPRMAGGSQRGTDYSSFMSWVQDEWPGRSGLGNADAQGFRFMKGFVPTLPSYDMYAIPSPTGNTLAVVYTSTGDNFMATHFVSPVGTAPRVLSNLGPHIAQMNFSNSGLPPRPGPIPTFWPSRTRIYAGNAVIRPQVQLTRGAPSVASVVDTTLGFVGVGGQMRVYAGQAVSYSTVAFIAPYIFTSLLDAPLYGKIAPIHITNVQMRVHAVLAEPYGHTYYVPVGSTVVGALGVYDKKLWKSAPKGDQIAYYRPTETTLGLWSDGITVSPGTVILRMEEFIGRLMIGTYDGLYAYEAGRTYRVVDFSKDTSTLNFTVMSSISGSLWFNIRHRLFRYTSGGLLEELDILLAEYQYPMALESGENCVYLLAGSLVDDAVDMYRIDSATGATTHIGRVNTQSQFFANPAMILPTLFTPDPTHQQRGLAEVAGNPLCIGPLLTGVVPHSGGDDLELQVGIKIFGDIIPGLVPGKKDFTGSFATGIINQGYPAINKSWQRVRIGMVTPAESSITVVLKYRTHITNPYDGYDPLVPAADWTSLASVSATNNITISLRSNKIISKQIELCPVVTGYFGNSIKGQLGITSLELDSLLVGPQGDDGKLLSQHTFTTTIVDNMQLLNLEVENSAAFVTAALYSLAGSGIPHVVSVPFPLPVGHTTWAVVEFDPRGVMVPALGYQHITCPGSHVGIILREV